MGLEVFIERCDVLLVEGLGAREVFLVGYADARVICGENHGDASCAAGEEVEPGVSKAPAKAELDVP